MSTLPLFAIYYSPTDFPGKFVVRRFLVSANGMACDAIPSGIAETLEGARAFVPQGCIPIARSPGDVASIVETWL